MGNDIAILVGCGVFRSDVFGTPLKEIRKAVSIDLAAMKKGVMYGLLFPQDSVKIKEDCSRQDLFDLIHSCEKLKGIGTLFFYFSGHGSQQSIALFDGYVEFSEILQGILSLKAKQNIFVFDSCYSGAFVQTLSSCKPHFSNQIIAVVSSSSAEKTSACSSTSGSSFTESFALALYGCRISADSKVSLEHIVLMARIHMKRKMVSSSSFQNILVDSSANCEQVVFGCNRIDKTFVSILQDLSITKSDSLILKKTGSFFNLVGKNVDCLVSLFYRFQNGTIKEKQYKVLVSRFYGEIHSLYLQSTDLGNLSASLQGLQQCQINFFSQADQFAVECIDFSSCRAAYREFWLNRIADNLDRYLNAQYLLRGKTEALMGREW